VKYRLCFYFPDVRKTVCLGCSNTRRAVKRQIDEAERGLKDLKNEVKQINKQIKDLQNGTQ